MIARARLTPPEARRRLTLVRDADPGAARPIYQLRATTDAREGMLLRIWQLPSSATPRLTEPEYTAGIHGRPLRLLEARVLRRLRAANVSLADLRPGEERRYDLPEETALNLALLFRALAPMHSIDRIEAVAAGIDAMSREEASYWLGMALNRRQPRRVLAALRMLLTTP